MSGNSQERRKARRVLERANAHWREAHAEEITKVLAWIESVEVPEFVSTGFESDGAIILRHQSEKMTVFALPSSTREELRRFLVQKGVFSHGGSSTALAILR